MYPLTANPPAPYELSTQPQSQMGESAPTALARGGRAKHRKMVIAHFNPKELNVLDHLQGEQERCPKTGLRSYSHLEELLKNPHIVENVHKHVRREHHAYGGDASLEHLAGGGRHGDTEIALIGPHTHHLFDSLAGHRTVNPHTGHPEYFSLGKTLRGAWHAIKGGANAIIPGAGNLIGGIGHTALGTVKNLVPDAGGLWNTFNKGVNTVGSAAQGALKGVEGSLGGFGHSVRNAARGFGNQVGNAAQNAYRDTTGALRGFGNEIGNAAQSAYGDVTRGLSGFGNQVGNAAQNAYGDVTRGLSGFGNQIGNAAQNAYRDYRNNWQDYLSNPWQ